MNTNTNKKKTNVYYLVAMGLMIALVFIGSQISITIPVSVAGQPSRVHFGNIFCLFAGFILGPVGGGLAAGIGSALYDFTNPIYFSSMPFTFAFKFVMAFVCGKIAYMRNNDGKSVKANAIAGVLGIVAYVILYLTRNYIKDITFVGLEQAVALINLTTRGVSSLVNGVIAVVIAVPLGIAIRKALDAGNMIDKIRPDHTPKTYENK